MRYIIICFALLLGNFQLRAEQTVRNGDVFEFRLSGAAVEYLQEFVNLAVVVDNGSVNVPIIGRVNAQGMTTTQLSAAIEKKYREEKIFTNPIVALNPVQTAVNQRSVIVGGAVRAPGQRPWSAELTLTAAIAMAGGADDFAKDTIKIIRDQKAFEYSRKKIAKDPTLDPKVLPNDMISIDGSF